MQKSRALNEETQKLKSSEKEKDKIIADLEKLKDTLKT